jgi:hypothetical protein
MMRGQAVVIPGFQNKFSALSLRFGPRWLVRHISRKLNESKADR